MIVNTPQIIFSPDAAILRKKCAVIFCENQPLFQHLCAIYMTLLPTVCQAITWQFIQTLIFLNNNSFCNIHYSRQYIIIEILIDL